MSEELVSLYDGSDEVLAAIRSRTPQAPPRAVGEIVRTYHPKRLELTVAAVLPQSPTAVTLRLHRDHGDLPPFLAGQYVNVFYDATSRPYAMSSAPGADHYDLTIKRVAGGRVSNALIDRVRVGDVLTTTGPMGTFHHNPLFHGDDLVFLAGGSGVVPAMSMIQDILGENLQRRLHLIHGVTGPLGRHLRPGVGGDHGSAHPGGRRGRAAAHRRSDQGTHGAPAGPDGVHLRTAGHVSLCRGATA